MIYRFAQLFKWTSGKGVERSEGPYPLYGSNGIIGSSERAPYKNRIIIGRVGAYCGSVMYEPGEFDATDNTLITTCDDNILDYKYASYLLKQYHLNSFAGGAAQPVITQGVLKHLKCDVPAKSIQKEIACILSKYDDLIELNNRRIKLLEQTAEEIYKEWFVRFRFPGYENAEFENNIPKGWEYIPAQGLCSILRRGISPIYDDNGKYVVISQKCIRGNVMDIREAKTQSKVYLDELNLQDGDTVICSTGTGTLGRVGKIVGEYNNTTYDSHVTLARAKNNIGKHFLYGSMKNLQQWFMGMGIGSTNQQELYISTIRNAKVLVPKDIKVLTEYEEMINPIHKRIGLLIQENDNLVKQRDYLLPRLMSGKLDV